MTHIIENVCNISALSCSAESFEDSIGPLIDTGVPYSGMSCAELKHLPNSMEWPGEILELASILASLNGILICSKVLIFMPL